MRRTAAGVLIFSGAVALIALALDQVLPTQRPTRPLVALALGAALIATGCLMLDRSPKSPVPAAVPGAAPPPQTAGDLWAVIIAPPALVGLYFSGLLINAPPEGGEWSGVWEVLGGIVFLGLWAVAMSKPFLRELARRGGWVPPGTARRPALVAVALTALLAVAVVAVLLTLVRVERLSGLAK